MNFDLFILLLLDLATCTSASIVAEGATAFPPYGLFELRALMYPLSEREYHLFDCFINLLRSIEAVN